MNHKCDVVIIGAGAAGMMCAIQAGKRGRKVVLLDHAKKIGEKIRISGGVKYRLQKEKWICRRRHSRHESTNEFCIRGRWSS